MASASSTSSALRRRGPYIPLIPCPDCGRTVKRKLSGTTDHNGWIFYTCETHRYGCDFWRWELEYVHHLVENKYIRGDAAVDAVGWAEERRQELMLRNAHEVATGAPIRVQSARDDMLMKKLTEVLTMLKIVAGILAVICVVLAVKK